MSNEMKRIFEKLLASLLPYKHSSPVAAIFLFHSVESNPSPWTQGHRYVTPTRCFLRQIKHIKRNFDIVETSKLLELLKQGNLRANLAAIHFDDGFRSYVDNALPLLKAEKIPSTLFVPMSVLDGWIPTRNKISFIIAMGKYDCLVAGLRKNGFKISNEKKELGAAALLVSLKGCQGKELDEACDSIMEEISSGFAEAKPFIDRVDLESLSKESMVELGSHTISHPLLSKLDEESQRQEIVEGHKKLESACGRSLHLFAYPYGGNGHFNETSKKIVSELQSLNAFSAYGGINHSFDRLDSKRITLSNEIGFKLKVRISKHFIKA